MIISIVSNDKQKAYYTVSGLGGPSRIFVHFSGLCAASIKGYEIETDASAHAWHAHARIASLPANDAGPKLKGQFAGGGVPYL